MKTPMLALCGTVALATVTAQAANISYSTTAPTPGVYDIGNLSGASADQGNVSDGGTYSDGAGNDAFTYIAFDRGAQGQTFTTGGLFGGYQINAIWLQHAGYTANTDATWYMVPGGSRFQIRLTNPGLSGTAGFVLGSEVATTTGAEPNALPTGIMNSPNGTGTWLRFGLDNPLALAANTQYGFDVSSPSSFGGFGVQPFFESLGTSSDVYAGGAAYSSGANGSGGDSILTGRIGDRVFMLELSAVPEPGSAALLGLGGLALVLRWRKS